MINSESQNLVDLTDDVDGSHIGHDAQHCEHILVLEFRPDRDFMFETLIVKWLIERTDQNMSGGTQTICNLFVLGSFSFTTRSVFNAT